MHSDTKGFDIHSYDYYIVSFSGGKDSTACLLYLRDNGVPADKIELWHQDIDGRGNSFMDWEITPAYCRKVAEAFGVKIYFQWKVGGFKGEMLRENSLTLPNCFELPDGSIKTVGGIRGKQTTRLKFPQCSPDLKVRWCSGYLKINVCSQAIINQERFVNKKTLVLSGERGEESAQRAKYKIFEPDKADLRNGKGAKRHVDRLRPIRDWKEEQVWEIIERYRVRAHPCYYMGWNRCSCKFCVFGNTNQFASAKHISPVQMQEIIDYENSFGCSIKRTMFLPEFIKQGSVYPYITAELMSLATGYDYCLNVILADDETWEVPAGAYTDKSKKKKI